MCGGNKKALTATMALEPDNFSCDLLANPIRIIK
jgi:hypothetical protein